jgi:hypothetical protein
MQRRVASLLWAGDFLVSLVIQVMILGGFEIVKFVVEKAASFDETQADPSSSVFWEACLRS